MEITKIVTNKVEVQYTVQDGIYSWQGTDLFAPDELAKLDLTKHITDKYNSWKSYVTTPTKVPTKVDEEAKLAQLQKDKVYLDGQISMTTNKIALFAVKVK